MIRTTAKLRSDALAIWRAGVDAVRSDRLVKEHVRVEKNGLIIGEDLLPLDAVDRIVAVGAGKAGAGMAAGLEEALGEKLSAEKQLSGWINVPEDCLQKLRFIHLHSARPAGQNEPTQAGVEGTTEIVRLVAALGPRDLCLCLLSGGGSALLPAPVAEITLAEKLDVTKHLSAAAASIHELNTVRKQLSRIKGGGLARACRAGRLITLIISDVLGDPLDIIASGPTVADRSTPAEALAILEKFRAGGAGVSPRVFDYLRSRRPGVAAAPTCVVENIVIGNNAVAVDGAGVKAEQLGYSHAMHSAKDEPGAEVVGRQLAEVALRMRSQPGPDALISGGEPVVRLIDASQRGLGGRNQQLALAALERFASANEGRDIVLLSGGTDGEDGPTDAAGAVCDVDVMSAARQAGLDPLDFLARNDAYRFFAQTGGLIKTGPTHTNVCDLRVVLVAR